MTDATNEHPCRYCGAGPALWGSIISIGGLGIWVAFRNLSGPFCRDCGLTLGRDAMAHTLVWGWFGASALLSPFMLAQDALLLRKIDRLGPPGPPAPGRSTLKPGRPLTSRPHIAGLLVPVALLAVLIVFWTH